MSAPRSMIATAAVLLFGMMLVSSISSAFVPAAHKTVVKAPAATGLPTAALSAAALVAPTAAHAEGGSVWIPALSAVGAGFAIGLAAIGSGVG
eukprot:CAMPEP_0113841692 /NCGR_PEP_ID=MMETSP0328-20130328/12298_1 /TAXON_ID=39455 /ORGANISM="Alexandrium minutum" /LENGTH=92 /DNA_ID=CAMNT_0000810489 /DNA_START=96 /DNA_END=370 /DNA_ORIENTATION=- /assembly_acc=CAM_ASM_000350